MDTADFVGDSGKIWTSFYRTGQMKLITSTYEGIGGKTLPSSGSPWVKKLFLIKKNIKEPWQSGEQRTLGS